MSFLDMRGTRPTAESLRHRAAVVPPHVDGTHKRPYWTAQTRIGHLHAQGQLEDTSYEAACRFRTDFEREGRMNTAVYTRVVSFGTSGAGTLPTEDQVEASARLDECRALLAEPERWLLRKVLIEDASWRSLAKTLGVTTTTVKERVRIAVKKLESVYEPPPSSGARAGHSTRSSDTGT